MEVTMLLCDAAQAAGGKLYVLGGGWTHVYSPNNPVPMALAVLIAVSWNRANERHTVEAILVTADGATVEFDGNQIMASGEFEVGRPAGIRAGTQLNTALAFNFGGLALDVGDYVWELRINGGLEARAPFRVDNPPLTG
jgi:hypothetical protein